MKRKERIHVTKDGLAIPLSQISDTHLLNIIRYARRKARDGIRVWEGGGYENDEMWFEAYTVEDEEAEELLSLNEYLDEMKRRGLTELPWKTPS